MVEKDLLAVIAAMVERSPKTQAQIAEEIGKPVGTLARELNVFDEGAKVGVQQLIPLMLSCESADPLRYLAARMGFRLESLAEVVPDKPTLHEEMLDTIPHVIVLHSAMLNKRPVHEVEKLVGAAVKDLLEDLKMYREASDAPVC